MVEADEYDTAFFDKRSKFVHYRPEIAILNNLEYDHADIFPDLAAIQRQFHHLPRSVPRRGKLIVNAEDQALAEVLAMGCWTPVERFGIDVAADWTARLRVEDGSVFEVYRQGHRLGEVHWTLLGRHNVMNALAALAAASAAGADPVALLPAFGEFHNVKRRLQVLGTPHGQTVYDDFAHHPTAIRSTLAGLRAKVGSARIVVAIEPRSNSMRLGAHVAELAPPCTRPIWSSSCVDPNCPGMRIPLSRHCVARESPWTRLTRYSTRYDNAVALATMWCSCRTAVLKARRSAGQQPLNRRSDVVAATSSWSRLGAIWHATVSICS